MAGTDPPGNPGRGPFDIGYPDPAVVAVKSPPAVMVASPGPRLVTGPIPASVCPNPRPGAIRPPPRGHVSWTPAAAIRIDINPDALRGQWRVEVSFCVDLDGGGDFEVGVDAPRAQKGAEQNEHQFFRHSPTGGGQQSRNKGFRVHYVQDEKQV